MARKGNQHRNGVNRNAAEHNNKVSDMPDKENSGVCELKFSDVNHSNDDKQCKLNTPRREDSMNKNRLSGKRSKQMHAFSKDNSVDKSSVDRSSKLGDSTGDNFTTDSTDIVDESLLGKLYEGEDINNDIHRQASPYVVASVKLKDAASYALKTVTALIEQQKPLFRAATSIIYKTHSYVRGKVDKAYPIIWSWTLNFGKVMFFISMIWLDCTIRGLDSLLRLGATSFFTILWCSVLSITTMIGFTKMLMIMVIAILVGFFIGIGLALLLIATMALLMLWLYGSFWTTGLVLLFGGSTFYFGHERIALLVTTIYSIYSAKSYVGWLGLLLGLNLAFISSDVSMLLLKNSVSDHNSNSSSEEARQSYGQAGPSVRESMEDGAFQTSTEGLPYRGPGSPSTSGSELTSEDEVFRLLNCTDHYAALGFSRFETIDVSILKKEYKKKAMLVHPDKNLGNERAAEAFKKLQNAYEVLLDSLKRKTYDDELRREELLNYFRRFQNAPQKKGSRGIFRPGFSHSEAEYEGPYGEARRIACKKCNDYHVWICTAKSKSQARWCQECKELHQAKDGDGWVEQSFQPLLFGLLQKMDPPSAYVCAGSRVFDVTEWFICQGMRCPANTHKPSFHVNTSLTKQTSSKGTTGTKGGAVPGNEFNETMTEEEFFEWLQNAVQSGLFEASNTANDSPKSASSSKNSSKKKKKGKKQW